MFLFRKKPHESQSKNDTKCQALGVPSGGWNAGCSACNVCMPCFGPGLSHGVKCCHVSHAAANPSSNECAKHASKTDPTTSAEKNASWTRSKLEKMHRLHRWVTFTTHHRRDSLNPLRPDVLLQRERHINHDIQKEFWRIVSYILDIHIHIDALASTYILSDSKQTCRGYLAKLLPSRPIPGLAHFLNHPKYQSNLLLSSWQISSC